MDDEKKDSVQKQTEPHEGDVKNFCDDPAAMTHLFKQIQDLGSKPHEEDKSNKED